MVMLAPTDVSIRGIFFAQTRVASPTGDFTNLGALTFETGSLTARILNATPTLVGGETYNNFVPSNATITNAGTSLTWRMTSTGDGNDPVVITGLAAATRGRVVLWHSLPGGVPTEFAHESESSDPASRIVTPTGLPYVVYPGETAIFVYDNTTVPETSRWLVIVPSPPSSVEIIENGAASPIVETTIVTGSDPTVTLAAGQRDGAIKRILVSDGSGSITLALVQGVGLTVTGAGASVTLVWGGAAWWVVGQPYNMTIAA